MAQCLPGKREDLSSIPRTGVEAGYCTVLGASGLAGGDREILGLVDHSLLPNLQATLRDLKIQDREQLIRNIGLCLLHAHAYISARSVHARTHTRTHIQSS